MPVFHSQFLVRASLDHVFSFHRNARNLPLIQPPYPRVLSLKCPDILEVGDLAELELGPFPRQIWKARVEELNPPHGQAPHSLMVDAAISAPFPFFRHRHAFRTEGDCTRIRDTLDFDPPWGKIGWLMLPGIYACFYLMFFYRRVRTRQLLEK